MSPKTVGRVLLSGVLFLAVPAWGEEFQVFPSVSVKEEFNDNLFLTASDRQDVFITTVSPGVEALRRSERSEAGVSARLNALFYSDESDRDALDQAYRGRFAFRPSPLWRTSAEGSHTRESRPDRNLEETGLTVTDTSRHTHLGGGVEGLLAPRVAAEARYGYEKVDYDSRERLDSEAHTFSLSLSRDVAPELKGRGSLAFARYSFPDSTVESTSATFGVLRQVNEAWSLTADAGGRVTRSELAIATPLGPVERETDDTGWVGAVALSYRGETGGGGVRFSRNVTLASGRGGATERTSFVLDLNQRFTWELSGRFTAGYHTNRAEGGEFSARKIDEETIIFNPALRYDFSRDTSLEASYQYSRVLNDVSGSEAEQNRIFIRLTARADFRF